MTATVSYLVVVVAFCFWLIQVIDLLKRDERDFESHTHKLTWFVVLIVGNLAGAIWYFGWKKRLAAGHSVQTRE
jgi:H+/Cl- antiporter ClcA